MVNNVKICLNKEIYDGMTPGNTMGVCFTSLADMKQMFERYKDHYGVDWEMMFWTEPEVDDDVTARTVNAVRIDGLSASDIQEIRNRHIRNSDQVKEFTFAPKREGWPKPTGPVAKGSKSGWERMLVGESKFSRLYARDLRRFIGKAMMARDLDWEFRMTRAEWLDKNRCPAWKVTRIK